MRVLKPIRLSNGFLWTPVHYSHDPDKRSHEWLEKMRASFPRPTDWDKEMEIDFGSHAGAPAYPQYSDVRHLQTGLSQLYDERRPLLTMMDFNANPMTLLVWQKNAKRLFGLREFVYAATIDDIIADFRLSYPEHKSTVVMYGDATKGTNAQTATGNWDVVKMAFRGWHVQPTFRVPIANPGIGNRLLSVNRLLSTDSPCPVLIDPDTMPEFVRDCREVILTPDGKKIHKVTDPDDPYYFRTHPTDAFGYYAMVEWPTVGGVMEDLSQKRKPIEYGKLLGEVVWGTESERAKQQPQKKRNPIDRSRAR